jgi:hypothetical protein
LSDCWQNLIIKEKKRAIFLWIHFFRLESFLRRLCKNVPQFREQFLLETKMCKKVLHFGPWISHIVPSSMFLDMSTFMLHAVQGGEQQQAQDWPDWRAAHLLAGAGNPPNG